MDLFNAAGAEPLRRPVYVDEAKHAYGRMLMCHMFSPDLDALHAMADRIEVARKWFQDPRTMPKVSWPHYDIAKSKRALAVAAGAIECDRYQMVVMSKVVMNRVYGLKSDPLAVLRGKEGRLEHWELPRVRAWLEAELAKLS